MKVATLLTTASLLLVAPLWAVAAEGSDSKAKKETNLFNGKNFKGWELFLGDDTAPETIWSIKDGEIHCTGAVNGYLRTKKKYENYKLTFDWKYPEQPSNSGVLLHMQQPDAVWAKCIEGQMKSGKAGMFVLMGGATVKGHANPDDRVIQQKKDSSENPVGEWNTYEVVCKGDTIRLTVNGVEQNYCEGASITKGHIGWQSEGGPIVFRNLVLTPLAN